MEKENQNLVCYPLIKAHLYFAVLCSFIVVVAGLTYSMQFIDLYPFPRIEWLSPGRVRMIHTQAIAYAWLANIFFAVLLYMLPKLTQKPILSEKFGWFCFYVYNTLILLTVVMILGGFAQAVEWGETPVLLDPFIAVAAVCWIVNVVGGCIWRGRDQQFYVSVWYFLAALIWLPLVYVMGNFLPQYVFAGTGGATIVSMYIHDLVGLFVTPIGIGMVYYLLPILLKKPLYSHALSLIGFWGLAFFYPMNSAHHFLWSPIPMWTQYASVVASVGMHVVVYTVVFNIFATMASDWKKVVDSIPLRFIFMGALFYLITCIQCAIHVTLSVQEYVHFTDWVVGHAHLVLFGTFSFWAFAFIYHFLPKITGNELFSNTLAEWHFWLSVVGMVLMDVVLICAGLIQGTMWKDLAPFIDTVIASKPYWWIRTLCGCMLLVAEVCFFINVLMTYLKGKKINQPASNEVMA